MLREAGLAPAALELEITESMVMHDPERAAKLLGKLKTMGVIVAIDDFGTGYSSLSYLKRFPIDSLKIDRSFIKDLPLDSDDAAITLAIIVMAHSLGLKVIAEGVENEDQARFLRATVATRCRDTISASPCLHMNARACCCCRAGPARCRRTMRSERFASGRK